MSDSGWLPEIKKAQQEPYRLFTEAKCLGQLVHEKETEITGFMICHEKGCQEGSLFIDRLSGWTSLLSSPIFYRWLCLPTI